jgi:serine/threonine-protein kinase RsbW
VFVSEHAGPATAPAPFVPTTFQKTSRDAPAGNALRTDPEKRTVMTSYETNAIPVFEPDFRPCTNTNKRAPARGTIRTTIASDLTEASRILEEIIRFLAAHEYERRDLFAIRLALDEALVNAVKHGSKMDGNKQVHIAYRVTDDRFKITIQDEGAGFNPDAVADPRWCDNLERLCGRGLLLMRHYMSEVMFHPPGNKVTLTKLRTQKTEKRDS